MLLDISAPGDLIVAEQSDFLSRLAPRYRSGWCTGTTIWALEAGEPLQYGEIGHAGRSTCLLTHGTSISG
jgi:hypothetical protein